MKRLLLSFLLFLFVRPGGAAAFEDANRLYEQGKFAEAIPLYQTLLKSGHHSPGVIFNLGNSHFKNGELGRAIYYYRRAQQISPRDPDIHANLRFARERVAGSVSVPPTLAERALRRVSLNEVAVTAALLLWIFLGLLALMRWKPDARASCRPFAIGSAILLALVVLVLGAAWNTASQAMAIVTTSQAVIRLGPLAESQTAYTASDGAELPVLARRDEWLQVIDRSGRAGWISASDVLVLGDRG